MSEISTGMPQNTPTGKHVRTRSKFPLQYQQYDTMRFGEIHPHFVMEGVSSDKISVRSSHEVRSFTMKAPLMADISMKKVYFNVPLSAIIPNNWSKFIGNPVIGDDVQDKVGPVCPSFWGTVVQIGKNLTNRLRAMLASGSNFTDVQVVEALLRYCVLNEYWFSSGSLMASLGIPGHQYFEGQSLFAGKHVTFDKVVDDIAGVLNNFVDVIYVTDTNNQQHVFITALSNDYPDLHDLFELYREDPGANVTGVTFSSGETLAVLKSNALGVVPIADSFSSNGNTRSLNFQRLASYQLSVAQFFTNDQIDFIFDANLYRQLMWYYHQYLIANSSTTYYRSFTYNGIDYDYDAFSGHVLFDILSSVQGAATSSLLSAITAVGKNNLSYLSGLFAFRRSLRFKDYFTGSHSQPLAVADVSFDASNTSVIDITKNIQKQRFLNAVNRVGARIEDYMLEVFGKRLAPDFTKPFYLSMTSDVVYGSETENTGDKQLTEPNSVTSALRSNGSRYEFTFEPDRDCVIIGVTYFDVPRAYDRAIDRQAFHSNRFDYFNPYMQFIGDQEVYNSELNQSTSGGTFAYQLRHMEYKQRYNRIVGGFVSNLPAWAFRADAKFDLTSHISSDYIRSHNSELDPFYVSLTGTSLGTYFHFIVKNNNDCVASRPMAYAPSIL